MVKLFASSTLSALSLATAIGAAGASSHLQTPPAALHHLHNHLVQRTLRDVISPQHHRRATVSQQFHRSTSTEDCPGTPFLWKIMEDDTGKHVGFGLGTMHLPVDVVTTPDAYTSIKAAIEDSCDVYGELNLADTNVTAELMGCLAPLAENSATVDDIPDEELREAIKAKILEIAIAIDCERNATATDDCEEYTTADAEFYATRLLTLPLPEIQRIILYGNTPEYRDKYLHTILSDSGTVVLDTHVLSYGRPADDLEEVSTQCEILKAIHPSAEEMKLNFAEYATSIKNSLNASLTKEIDMYECGNIDAFVEEFTAGMAIDDPANDVLLTDRNIQMAAKMNDVLKANPDEKIMFAVGNAHWIIGTQSLELLLKNNYGYTLEHIPNWNTTHAENHSTEHCEVILHPETGLFVSAPELFAPGAAPVGGTKEPTHSVVRPTYYTLSTLAPATGNEDTTDFELTKMTDTPTAKPTTKMPSGGATGEGEVASASVANEPSSSTILGASKMVLAGGFIYLWNCI